MAHVFIEVAVFHVGAFGTSCVAAFVTFFVARKIDPMWAQISRWNRRHQSVKQNQLANPVTPAACPEVHNLCLAKVAGPSKRRVAEFETIACTRLTHTCKKHDERLSKLACVILHKINKEHRYFRFLCLSDRISPSLP
jgi:hypothetical protein